MHALHQPSWNVEAIMRQKRFEAGVKAERDAEGYKLQLIRLEIGSYVVEASLDGALFFRKVFIIGSQARDTYRKWRPTWKGDA